MLAKNIETGKNLLLISLFFPPEFGGGSTGAWNRALVLQKIGYTVFVLCGFPAYPTGKVSDPRYKGKFFLVEKNGPFTIIRVRLLPISHTGLIKRLLIFANFILVTIVLYPKVLSITGRISLVYARSPILFSSIIGFIYSKLARTFFIYEAPDLWPEELTAVKTKFLPLLIIFGKRIAQLSYSTPDIVITISELAEKHIVKEYKPRVPVYGIPVGVDTAKFPILSKLDARQNLIQQKILPTELIDRFLVLYSGLISEAQRVENLVYAAERLRDAKITILIVGEGPMKAKLQQIKSERGIDNVYLLPPQPRNVMPSLISAVDVCTVMLSSEPIFDIALPTKFYEYLACGKPLVGVCSGELANIINTNKIGRIVEFGDIDGLASSIGSFNNSPDSLYLMETNCRSALQAFSLDAIAARFRKIIATKEESLRLA